MRASVPGLLGLLCTLCSLLLVGQVQGAPPPPSVVPHALEKLPEAELLLSGVLDVNRANAKALEALPGVGPATAAAIVADRERRGPFVRVESLERVKGIGPAKLEAIRPFVKASPLESAPDDGGLSAPEGYARRLDE